MRDSMLAVFAEGDLPNNTYYGDGLPIEASASPRAKRDALPQP